MSVKGDFGGVTHYSPEKDILPAWVRDVLRYWLDQISLNID